MGLPWAAGFAESAKLMEAFTTAIWRGDGGSSTPASRTPKVAEGLDVVVFLVFTAALVFINWGVRLGFVQPLAYKILRGPETKVGTESGKRAFERKLRTKVEKFAQTTMEQLFYGAFTIFGFVMVLSQEWAWPSKHWWIGFDETDKASGFSKHAFMPEAVAAYYIMYAARYFQGMVSVLLEHKRKDFWEMELHHFVTCALVTISYMFGWNRVGMVVMLVLDPADVPLHSAKMCKYIGERRCPGKPNNWWQMGSDLLFVVFMVSFFVTRLGVYPYVCWSAHIEATRYFPKGLPEWTSVILLYILLVLQVFWGWLIIRVLIKLIRDGHVEDNRSDDEDDGHMEGIDENGPLIPGKEKSG